VVLCITGNGLKTIDAVPDTLQDLPIIAPKLRELSALVEQSARP
jgi:threonine synthase